MYRQSDNEKKKNRGEKVRQGTIRYTNSYYAVYQIGSMVSNNNGAYKSYK